MILKSGVKSSLFNFVKLKKYVLKLLKKNMENKELLEMLNSIRAEIEEQYEADTLGEYLSDCLSVERFFKDVNCSGKKEYAFSEIMISWGGPNIWIDTRDAFIKGSWGGDTEKVPLSYEIRDYIDGYFDF